MSTETTTVRRNPEVDEITPDKSFVPARLPWIIAAAALVSYLLTLNHWLSVRSLDTVAMVAGWQWQPELTRPVYWLVTLPFRLLPSNVVPIALNLFSAFCGGLVLAILARCVALLPHDRTEDQRMRERSAFSMLTIRQAWLPPVVAVLFCGFQLSFWENATAASSDMLDLLLFAYVVRCILEFRLQGTDSWLFRAAFVYGASMTGNWAMIVFFPVFIASLIWVRGVGFFNLRFLVRMFVLGSLGLCFYLVLPAAASFSWAKPGFWVALKASIGAQKAPVAAIFSKYFLFQSDRPLWIVTLYSIVPLIAMSVRIPRLVDPSTIGTYLSRFFFVILNAGMLLLCLWVALDPQFSPRNHVGMSSLPLYFLSALCLGYFVGFFLLVFGGAEPTFRGRPAPGYPAVLNLGVTGGVWVLAILGGTLLFYRNLPQIRTTNGTLLRDFARLSASKLPKGNAVILSDDGGRLLLVEAMKEPTDNASGSIMLDTRNLSQPAYQTFLEKRYPGRWKSPVAPGRKEPLQNVEMFRLISGLSTNHPIYYLHPSFGYYFEQFYPVAHGLTCELVPYATNAISKPALSAENLQENESFWKEADATFLPAVLRSSGAPGTKRARNFLDNLAQRISLQPVHNLDAGYLSLFCSKSLQAWGVDLQRNGKLGEAAVWFDRAKDLNPDNVAADTALQANTLLQAGQKGKVQHTPILDEQLAKFRTMQALLNFNGPVDEATLCFDAAREFFDGGNFRQAAQEFKRVTFLTKEEQPENLASQIAFASACLYLRMPDLGLQAADEAKRQAERLQVSRTNVPNFLRLEFVGWLLKGEKEQARSHVEKFLEQYPDDEMLLTMAMEYFLNYGFESNAIPLVDQLLKMNAANTSAMVNKGLAYIRMNDYGAAIPPLTRVIDLGLNASADTNIFYAAVYNRGIALFKSNKSDAAARDFDMCQKAYPDRADIAYWLAEAAYANRDASVALKNYQKLVSMGLTNGPEGSNVLSRLQLLKAGNKAGG